MHGVPLGDIFALMWHVPQCRGGDVGVTCLSRAALALWLVLAASGSLRDLPLFLPRLLCDTRRGAASALAHAGRAAPWQCHGVSLATGLWGMDPLLWAAPPQPASTSLPTAPPRRCRCLWRLSPSPPAVCGGSGAGPVPVPVPIPGRGRQRRLLLRRSRPGAGPGSAGFWQRRPIPVPGGDPA